MNPSDPFAPLCQGILAGGTITEFEFRGSYKGKKGTGRHKGFCVIRSQIPRERIPVAECKHDKQDCVRGVVPFSRPYPHTPQSINGIGDARAKLPCFFGSEQEFVEPQ